MNPNRSERKAQGRKTKGSKGDKLTRKELARQKRIQERGGAEKLAQMSKDLRELDDYRWKQAKAMRRIG